ncbi:metallophosphoesterase family protein [Legionella maioricensis]|uniref:Metallophosphoesterase n=1 Tax=Legionella maioricensis TaxID=2896528 RepID=A0A9X2D241_9GAMM|nr:metallophosphoesterase [Legionella maioricensis]MCL9685119.1 metallophosphoesterase [Legionella maioricensis]MCL9688368.1 metallophosphoesterase [Legionella maioricensis]
MKLAWLTDIHLNFIDLAIRHQFYQTIIDTGCDGVLISGDIAEAPCVKELLQELAHFIRKPVYFVLGNHDYYRGQISDVRHEMTQLTESNEYLFWLPASNPQRLDNSTFLVGHDGWADGRLGNYDDSRVVLNDSRMIADLFQEGRLGKSQLLAQMQQLADLDASQLQKQLLQAVKEHAQRIIVVTHIPPFKEACLHEGKINNDDWLPYFSSKATGDVLSDICLSYPDINFLVFCGHTHDKAKYSPLPNLIVEAGHAEYNRPEIQKVISLQGQ